MLPQVYEAQGLIAIGIKHVFFWLPRRSSALVPFVKMSGFAYLRLGYAGTVFVVRKASNEEWAIQESNMSLTFVRSPQGLCPSGVENFVLSCHPNDVGKYFSHTLLRFDSKLLRLSIPQKAALFGVQRLLLKWAIQESNL